MIGVTVFNVYFPVALTHGCFLAPLLLQLFKLCGRDRSKAKSSVHHASGLEAKDLKALLKQRAGVDYLAKEHANLRVALTALDKGKFADVNDALASAGKMGKASKAATSATSAAAAKKVGGVVKGAAAKKAGPAKRSGNVVSFEAWELAWNVANLNLELPDDFSQQPEPEPEPNPAPMAATPKSLEINYAFLRAPEESSEAKPGEEVKGETEGPGEAQGIKTASTAAAAAADTTTTPAQLRTGEAGSTSGVGGGVIGGNSGGVVGSSLPDPGQAEMLASEIPSSAGGGVDPDETVAATNGAETIALNPSVPPEATLPKAKTAVSQEVESAAKEAEAAAAGNAPSEVTSSKPEKTKHGVTKVEIKKAKPAPEPDRTVRHQRF